VRSSARVAEIVLVVALIGAGAWLRWCHLGTPSLWWDELVQIRTADWDDVGAVWRMARDGVAPGTGNAGAVPVDYLLLHAWLAATPPPSPANLERHYRVPAFAFAVAALPLAWWLGRTLAGPATGAITLALLATSLPHVLYAAEARFYSLAVLASLANLATFVALVRSPSTARLLVFVAVGVGYVLSSLYGAFPLAAEHLVLAVLAWRAGARWRVLALAGSGLTLAAVLDAWFGASALGVGFGRGAQAAPSVLDAIPGTFEFFAGNVPALAATFAAALVAAPIAARRDRVTGAVAVVCLLSAFAIPVMVLLAQSKQYYYHPRHAMFLLPLVHVATAIVLARGLDRVLRAPLAAALVGVALVVAASATTRRAFGVEPLPFFHLTKTLRDFRGLTRTIAARTAAERPDERYLLVLHQQRPGHLANPVLGFYLDAYGIADRVMLAGVSEPLPALAELMRQCADGCRGPIDPARLASFHLHDPFDQSRILRRLLRIHGSAMASSMSGVGLVTWGPTLPPTPPGVVATRLDGLTLFEPAGPPAPATRR
jgi:hypothetical protein